MKVIQLIVFVMLGFSLCAQNSNYGVKIGADRTDMRPYPKKNSSKFGIVAGVTYQYEFDHKSNINIDALYTQKGVKGTVVFSDVLGQSIIKGKSSLKFNYLSLPIRYGMEIGKNNNFFARMGVVPSMILDANFIISADGDAHDRRESFKDDVKTIDLGWVVEFGVYIRKRETHAIYLMTAFNRSVLTPYIEEFTINAPKHLMIELSAGIRFGSNSHK